MRFLAPSLGLLALVVANGPLRAQEGRDKTFEMLGKSLDQLNASLAATTQNSATTPYPDIRGTIKSNEDMQGFTSLTQGSLVKIPKNTEMTLAGQSDGFWKVQPRGSDQTIFVPQQMAGISNMTTWVTDNAKAP
jgi:hypothetical protein